MSKRKSKKIGNIYGQFKLIDTFRENNDTIWVVECLKCGKIQRKSRHSVEKCITECANCGKPPKKRNSCGHFRERIYHIYTTMIQRTSNAKKQGYNRYGGRGIKVCKEWQEDFMKFYNWSMENGYDDSKTIDRINNEGNYEPNNCRWVDNKTQCNNKSNNRKYTINGETKTVAQWAEEYKIDRGLVYNRLRLGWTIEKSLTEPKDKRKWSAKHKAEALIRGD